MSRSFATVRDYLSGIMSIWAPRADRRRVDEGLLAKVNRTKQPRALHYRDDHAEAEAQTEVSDAYKEGRTMDEYLSQLPSQVFLHAKNRVEMLSGRKLSWS